jgi:hypothetical protein
MSRSKRIVIGRDEVKVLFQGKLETILEARHAVYDARLTTAPIRFSIDVKPQ